MEYAELIEWLAFEQLEGPIGDRRAEAYMASSMAQRHNLALTSKTQHQRRNPADFLMFKEQAADVATELAKAGIFPRKKDG